MLNCIQDVEKFLFQNQNKLSHFWYGGDLFVFTTDKLPDYELHLGAFGIVCATLFNKHTNEQIVRVYDKSNRGAFDAIMSPYIANDDELYMCIEGEHPEYTLDIDNNNWWELYIVDPKTKQAIDLGEPLDANYLVEAIDELMDNEDEWIELIRDTMDDHI